MLNLRLKLGVLSPAIAAAAVAAEVIAPVRVAGREVEDRGREAVPLKLGLAVEKETLRGADVMDGARARWGWVDDEVVESLRGRPLMFS